MVDQINQAIDIIVPWMDEIHGNEDEEDENEKIIHLSGYQSNTRPLYRIQRKRYIEIIRQQLKAKNRLLLRTFNTYAYYSCKITEMQQKVIEHLTSTNAYSLMMELNNTNQHHIEKHLNNINQRITLTLTNLLQDQSMTSSQWEKMQINQSKTQFASLSFLPNTRRENVPFHPIMNCHHDLTYKISHFLHHLLQPIYDRITYSKTFNTGIDAIYAMEEYHKKGFLRPNTRFVTLYIHDLSTIFPHEQTIERLQRFLHEFIIDGRIQGMTIQTIIDLVRLFLENQYCLYENKLYQLIRGSSFNSPLTMILANIYLYYWQQDLVAILDDKNELFGRCFDEIFLTWNETKDKLYEILTTINRPYSEMQMTITINDNINYLDVNIRHIYGDLKTQVAHHLNTEPYSLPYVFGHQQRQYRTLARAALIRATQCYINVSDFANELKEIQLSFQYNRFADDFFIYKFQLFLEEFNSTELELHKGDAYYNQSLYDDLRQNVYNYNQRQKKTKIKRFRQQTIQYRWKHDDI